MIKESVKMLLFVLASPFWLIVGTIDWTNSDLPWKACVRQAQKDILS